MDDGGKADGTFHDDTVGYGAEYVVHCGNRIDNACVVDGSRQVKEYKIQRLSRLDKFRSIVRRVFRSAAYHGICLFLQAFELLVSHSLVMVIPGCRCHVTLPHILDAVLWKITIHHCHIISLDIMEIACGKYRQSRFACSAFLRGESYINWFIHSFIRFNGDTIVSLFLQTFIIPMVRKS